MTGWMTRVLDVCTGPAEGMLRAMAACTDMMVEAGYEGRLVLDRLRHLAAKHDCLAGAVARLGSVEGMKLWGTVGTHWRQVDRTRTKLGSALRGLGA